jgi:hypothetical protein
MWRGEMAFEFKVDDLNSFNISQHTLQFSIISFRKCWEDLSIHVPHMKYLGFGF